MTAAQQSPALPTTRHSLQASEGASQSRSPGRGRYSVLWLLLATLGCSKAGDGGAAEADQRVEPTPTTEDSSAAPEATPPPVTPPPTPTESQREETADANEAALPESEPQPPAQPPAQPPETLPPLGTPPEAMPPAPPASPPEDPAAGGAGGAGGAGAQEDSGGATSMGGAEPADNGGAGSKGDAGPPEPEVDLTNCDNDELSFSFFLTSHAGLTRLSGSTDGFGGNLGGLEGADAICKQLAVSSTPCAEGRQWRAFLSTPDMDARDRVGEGPWHDRVGRLLASNLEELLKVRPGDADPEIKLDFPNEDGVLNQYPNGDGVQVDNHEILTGTGEDGRVYTQRDGGGAGRGPTQCPGGWTVEKATCWGWTNSEEEGCPRAGHSWPGFSGDNWMSVWNEGGCAPGGVLEQIGGLDGTRRVGSAGGYGGFYCFALGGQ